ncbi:cytochrome P450 monooxygenase pc-2 [Crucibulum laeve]|uniref:Cytochrome P450 monooxygenase pc-2 n=1 Tax=Crucibulum laeve TaxID=68775 RepID=A0A5C3LSX9_9AGAR|nr:cytochrome P450 monooxygenase pc-2 [Crucibulum laeve]
MDLPPGIVYLLPRLPRILAPPALVYIISYLLEAQLGFRFSGWALAISLVLSLPTALTLVVLWRDIFMYLDARSRGAVLPPARLDRSPGSIRSLLAGMRNFKSGYPGEALDLTCDQLGEDTFNFRILFANRIITRDPDNIKAILATHFDSFEKGPETRHLFYPLLGTGVFAADGDMWKFHRSISRPFFSRDRISHFDNFDRHAEDALEQVKARLREGHPIDFQDMVSRFTLDSATEFLFGNDVKSLSAGLPYPHNSSHADTSQFHPANEFAHAFSTAQSLTAWRSRFGVHWPLFEFWEDKMKKHLNVIHSFIDPIVAEAVSNYQSLRTAAREKFDTEVRDDQTLLENLVSSTQDPIILRDEIMSLLVAGRDTTASALTFTIYMLAEHPEILRRLREEILKTIGPTRRPTYEDFRDMKYLRAVINETLRLFPAVPFNHHDRASKEATTWPSKFPGKKPFYIPANTRTPYSVICMHRRKDLWGPDALEFDPDRFLDERLHKYLTPNPFIFLPFNAGPRICLGQQFAYNEASFFLVQFLQNFSSISLDLDAQPPKSRVPREWANAPGRKGIEKVRPKTHLTMYVEGGLWVRLEESSQLNRADK